MMHMRFKMVFSMVMMTLFISSGISAFIVFFADDIIVNNSITAISSAVFQTASELDASLTYSENIGLTLRQYFQDTIDIETFNKDETYKKNWLHHLDQMVQTLSLETSHVSSVYVYLVPNSLNELTALAYGDHNQDGVPEKLAVTHPATLKADLAPYYYETWMSKNNVWYAEGFRENRQPNALEELTYNVRIQVNGSTFAIVSIGTPFASFIKPLEAMPLQSGVYPVLIDSQYKILIHPTLPVGTDLTQIFESRFEEKIDQASKESFGFKAYDWEKNLKKILVFKKLSSQWTVAAAIEKTTLYAPYDNLLKGLLGLFVVSGVIAVVISYEVTKNIYKPIASLSHEVSTYDLSVLREPLIFKGPFISKEIHALAHALHELEKHISHSVEKLVFYNQQLEKDVQIKGTELLRINDMLGQTVTTLEHQSDELKHLNLLLENNKNAIQKAQTQIADSEKVSSVGFLVSGISHELNTPIGNNITLASYIESEMKRLQNQLTTQPFSPVLQTEFNVTLKHSLQLIENNLRQGQTIIHRIKTLTTTDEETAFTDIDLNSFLIALSEKLFQQYPEKDLSLRIISDSNLLLTTNLVKLTQVFEQLFLNSILHGFEGRRTGQILIRYHLTKTDWVVHYFDDGSGIEASHHQHIFTPFFSTKFGIYKGLGLNMVYNLVTLFFNGQISCDTNATLGVHFEMHLRIKDIKPLQEVTTS